MEGVKIITWGQVFTAAEEIVKKILDDNLYLKITDLYGIPRGGIFPALYICSKLNHASKSNTYYLVERPHAANYFIDDIIDSGKTKKDFQNRFANTPFYALFSRQKNEPWYSFPWERMQKEEGPEDNIKRILEYLGEDINREGLQETPQRVVRSWDRIYGGYKIDPKSVLKVFTDVTCDEMIVLRDCEFFSTCEHHLLPFFGKAHIGYIPDGKVVGISKLARLLEAFARRAQIQERIGEQITNTLMDVLKPKGCGVVLEAQHFCMTSRGVEKQNSVMVTSSLKDSFLEQDVKSEFLRMIGK